MRLQRPFRAQQTATPCTLSPTQTHISRDRFKELPVESNLIEGHDFYLLLEEQHIRTYWNTLGQLRDFTGLQSSRRRRIDGVEVDALILLCVKQTSCDQNVVTSNQNKRSRIVVTWQQHKRRRKDIHCFRQANRQKISGSSGQQVLCFVHLYKRKIELIRVIRGERKGA